jgi:glycine/D-amino acid oxidase-like deaminating enzyme
MVAYHIWDAIAADEKLAKLAGVRMKNANFFFPVPVEEDEAQASKMSEIMQSGVRGFRRDAAIITKQRVSPAFGAVDAYSLLAPIIDTDACMSFLKTLVSAKGATLVTRTITGDLFHQEHALRVAFAADAILNCTGLASTDLANDPSCYPIRGALLRVRNNGTAFPKLDHALTCTPDPVHNRSDIVFLVPRNDDVLLIGGIVEPHETSLDLTLDSPVIRRMRARCEAFLPDLKHAELDEEYPLAQGLRPFRQRNIRVERELRVHDTDAKGRSGVSRIVHSYGHGGAGWSLCFGCAGDVLALVEEALADMPARPMGVDVVAVRAGEPDSFKDPARVRL